MAVNNMNKKFHVQDSLDNFVAVVSKESKGRLLIFTIHLFNIMNSCSYKYGCKQIKAVNSYNIVS